MKNKKQENVFLELLSDVNKTELCNLLIKVLRKYGKLLFIARRSNLLCVVVEKALF